jgi:Homeodomain
MEREGSPEYAFISAVSTTYHPENPLENAIIDNPGLARRRRRKTTARELEILEMAFKECEKPSKEIREEIASKTGMDLKAVQVQPP